MTGWRISPLPDGRLAEAWPLVRLRHPCWTLETWLAEARTLLADAPAAGVLAAQTAAGYIYAVCGYQLDELEHGGSELRLRIVANAGWSGTDDPLGPLVAAVETVARVQACLRIRVDGPAIAAAGETARWERLGYHWLGTDLCKELRTPAALPAAIHRSAC